MLWPGAQCWQGTRARKASSTGGSRPRKTPRPHAAAGGLPDSRLAEAWPQSSRGPAWPAASSCCPVPLQRARETKQSPVLKETQSGLFTGPCSNLGQHRRVFSSGKGPREAYGTITIACKNAGLGQNKNSAAGVQPPLPGRHRAERFARTTSPSAHGNTRRPREGLQFQIRDQRSQSHGDGERFPV